MHIASSAQISVCWLDCTFSKDNRLNSQDEITMTSSFLLASTSCFPPSQLSISVMIICSLVWKLQHNLHLQSRLQFDVAVKICSISCSPCAWIWCKCKTDHHRGVRPYQEDTQRKTPVAAYNYIAIVLTCNRVLLHIFPHKKTCV